MSVTRSRAASAPAARIELKNVNGSLSVHHASDGKPLSPATNLLPSRVELASVTRFRS